MLFLEYDDAGKKLCKPDKINANESQAATQRRENNAVVSQM